jgi:chromosomal replication initiation ATPase DnaA
MDADKIIGAVAEACGCTAEEIGSPLRRRDLVAARKIIAYLLPYPQRRVGRLVGRDHSTVHYYRRSFEDGLRYDGFLRERYDEVMERLRVKGDGMQA